eukprot:CAMPEP_0175166322 /NCGR_PEP_ID=MMETSP0087-20121206/27634_1 /TAXON_ID=136419 /ORGANISM="Unknown Unknown, Strain D1" /LENGTH=925 /DNA_ID=CAMNT_0016455911 /DNA_START=81 /DNA_END=2858 /DNA_ORIENTATION=+
MVSLPTLGGLANPNNTIDVCVEGQNFGMAPSRNVLVLKLPQTVDPDEPEKSVAEINFRSVAIHSYPVPTEDSDVVFGLKFLLPVGAGKDVVATVQFSSSLPGSAAWTSPSVPFMMYEQPILVNVTLSEKPETKGGVMITAFGRSFGPRSVTEGGAMELRFGSNLQCKEGSYKWASDSQFSCEVPPGVGKGLPVSVVAGGQSSTDQLIFSYEPPEVASIKPSYAVLGSKWEWVTITGNNFGPVTDKDKVCAMIDGSGCACYQVVMVVPHTSFACLLNPLDLPDISQNVKVRARVTEPTHGLQYQQISESFAELELVYPAFETMVLQPEQTHPTSGGSKIRIANISTTNAKSLGAKIQQKLQPDISIWVGTFKSNETVVHGDYIVSTVPPGCGSELNIGLSIGRGKHGQTAFTFSYDQPRISSVTAAKSTDAIMLTIQGQNFGVGVPGCSEPSVVVGKYDCIVVNTSKAVGSELITCQLNRRYAGQNLSVVVTVGQQSSQARSSEATPDSNVFTFPSPVLLNVTPTQVDLYSSTRISLVGEGFGSNQSEVRVVVQSLWDESEIACSNLILEETLVTCDLKVDSVESQLSVILNAAGQASKPVVIQATFSSVPKRDLMFPSIFAGSGVFVILLILLAVHKFKNTKPMKRASVKLVFVSLFGSIIFISSSFVNDQCQVQLLGEVIGFDLLFGSITAKNYRIFRVFRNANLQIIKITDTKLLKRIAVLILVDLCLLSPVLSSWKCGAGFTDLALVLMIAVFILKLAVLGLGLFVAIKTRNIVAPEYSETQELGLCIYSFCVFVMILLPAYIYLSSLRQIVPALVLRSVATTFLGTSTGVTLMVNKFRRIRQIKLFGEERGATKFGALATQPTPKSKASDQYKQPPSTLAAHADRFTVGDTASDESRDSESIALRNFSTGPSGQQFTVEDA